MIIVRAPNRISLLGGGTDYPNWFKEHGGLVIGGAIDKYSFVLCKKSSQFLNYKFKLVYSDTEVTNAIEEVQHRAIKAALQLVDQKDGLELVHASDLFGKCGLGSSSTFVVALLHSLLEYNKLDTRKLSLARQAIYIEQTMMGDSVGCQDQIFAAYGGFNRVYFNKDGTFELLAVTNNQAIIERLQDNLMLFFTGIYRMSSDIAKTYVPNLNKMERAQKTIHQLAEDCCYKIYHGDIDNVGPLMDLGWKEKKSLSPNISKNEIDEMYETAIRAGATGGKLTGSGGGGCLLLYVPKERQENVREALQGLIEIDFKFDYSGSKVIFNENGYNS